MRLLDAGELRSSKGWLAKQAESLDELLHPFSDKAVNSKLIALCVAQALCSVATLIHDTYLPIYLQDVLGLTNTKACLLPSRMHGMVSARAVAAWLRAIWCCVKSLGLQDEGP